MLFNLQSVTSTELTQSFFMGVDHVSDPYLYPDTHVHPKLQK